MKPVSHNARGLGHMHKVKVDTGNRYCIGIQFVRQMTFLLRHYNFLVLFLNEALALSDSPL